MWGSLFVCAMCVCVCVYFVFGCFCVFVFGCFRVCLWAPISLLRTVLNDATGRLSGARSMWSMVYGLAAAVFATASRLGWAADSAIVFRDERVALVDLQCDSPAYVQEIVRLSVSWWRWRAGAPSTKEAFNLPFVAGSGRNRGCTLLAWWTIPCAGFVEGCRVVMKLAPFCTDWCGPPQPASGTSVHPDGLLIT